MTREEAIKIVKSNWPEGRYQIKEALETLIPELTESDDERIRKRIILRLRYDLEQNPNKFTKKEIPEEIAYLEKQKELPTNEEMLGTLRTEYEKGVADTIAKYEQEEQKPAEWGEEDGKIYKVVLELLNSWSNGIIGSFIIPPNTDRYINWFKFLPERFNLQPKQEWSEEDARKEK